jgi:hypothetical protein
MIQGMNVEQEQAGLLTTAQRRLRESAELEAVCARALLLDAAEAQWRDSAAGREALRRFREPRRIMEPMGMDEGFEDFVGE